MVLDIYTELKKAHYEYYLIYLILNKLCRNGVSLDPPISSTTRGYSIVLIQAYEATHEVLMKYS